MIKTKHLTHVSTFGDLHSEIKITFLPCGIILDNFILLELEEEIFPKFGGYVVNCLTNLLFVSVPLRWNLSVHCPALPNLMLSRYIWSQFLKCWVQEIMGTVIQHVKNLSVVRTKLPQISSKKCKSHGTLGLEFFKPRVTTG